MNHDYAPAAGLRGAALGSGLAAMQAQQPDPESTQPQLARVSERLHHCVMELDETFSVLEKRLDGVLNPVNVGKGLAEVAPPHPVRCPIGASMDARSDEVYGLTCRVRALLDRLAL